MSTPSSSVDCRRRVGAVAANVDRGSLAADLGGVVARLHAQQQVHADDRILLTSDLDFGEIQARSLSSVSVVIFRMRSHASAQVIARLAKSLADAAPALRRHRHHGGGRRMILLHLIR